MAGYVDEKVAKVTLDNKGFSKNADEAIAAINRLKEAFAKVNGKDATKNIASDMSTMTDTISKSTQKSEGLLSRLKGIFSRSTQDIDMSGGGRSIDRMNTDIASKTANTSSILSRLKGIFQKADNHEGFPNSIKSIDGLNSKIGGFDASPLSNAFANAASSVQNSLSVMDIALGNVLGGMMQKAIAFSGKFFRGYGDGLDEYKNKLGSIQTIMTNTEWEIPDTSTRMRKVSGALEDLNDYADKTIYSFADMTKNIGTFTAAGVSLDKATTAIKGISNLAAASGSSTLQASTGMYQLSQALASGRVSLQDWNSVVAAGMGGKLFQDALMKTAENMGVNIDKSKAFRETLKDGWLTSEVLLQTLKEFSEDESMLDAATKVKSFGQLVDTVQEAIGSGWATTWEYFLGGFEEAKEMWTSIGDIVNPFLNDDQGKYYDEILEKERSLGNYRNAMLKTWKDMGGQQALFNSIKNSFEIVFNAMTKFREGFRSVIGDYKQSAKTFYNVTKALEDFTTKLKGNTILFNTISSLGRLAGEVFMTFGWILKTVASGMTSVGKSSGSILLPIKIVMDYISEFLKKVRSVGEYSSGWFYLGRTISNVFNIIITLGRIVIFTIQALFKGFSKVSSGNDIFARLMATISLLTGGISKFLKTIENMVLSTDALSNVSQKIGTFFSKIGDGISKVINLLRNFSFKDFGKSLREAFSSKNIGGDSLTKGIMNIFSKVNEYISKGIADFKNNISSFNISDILKTLITGFTAFAGFKLFKSFGGKKDKGSSFLSPIIDPLKELVENGNKIVSKVTEVLDGVKDALSSFTLGVKAGTLLTIASSIMILAFSLKILAGMNSDELVRAGIGIGILSKVLTSSMKRLAGMDKIPPSTAMNMIGFAIAIRVLSSALKTLSDLSPEQLTKSSAAILALSGDLVASMHLLSKSGKVKVGVFKMLGFVFAIKMLAKSVYELSKYDEDTLLRTISSISALMLSLSTSMRIMNNVKIKLSTIIGLLVVVKSVRSLVESLSKIADINPERLIPSIKALSIIIAELVLAMQSLRGAKVNLRAIGGMLAFTYSIKQLVDALIDISYIEHSDLIPSIKALSIIIAELVLAMQSLRGAKVNLRAIGGMLAFTYSIKQLVDALIDISYIEPKPLVRSLKALSIIFGLLTLSTVVLSNMSGNLFGAIGSALILLSFVPVLNTIGHVLTELSAISWDGMKTALTGLTGTLAVLLTASGIISMFGASGIVGALSLVVLAGALVAMAVPLKILGSMSLENIGKALIALGGGLAILLISAGIAGLIAPGLLILSAALIALGIAALGIGGGLALAGVGISLIIVAIKKLGEIGPDVLIGIVNAIDLFLKTLSQRAPEMVTSLVNIVKNALDGLLVLIPKFVDFGFKLLISLLKGLTENIPELITAAVKLITELGKALIDNMDELVGTAVEIAVSFIKALGDALIGVKDQLIPALKNVFSVISEVLLTVLSELLAPLLEKIVEILTPVGTMITEFLSNLASAIEPIFTPLMEGLKVLFESIATIITVVAEAIIATVNAIKDIIRSIADIIISTHDTIQTIVNAIVEVFKIMADAIDTVITGVINIIDGVSNVIKTAGEAISGVLTSVGEVFKSFGEGVKTALDGVGKVVESFGTGIKTALEGVGKIFESIGTGIKTALDGVADVIKAVGDAAKSFGEGFKAFGEGVKLVGEHGATAATGLASLTVEVAKLGASAYAGNLQGFTTDIETLAKACSTLGDTASNIMTLSTSLTIISSSLTIISGVGSLAATAFQTLSTEFTNISTSAESASTAFLNLSGPVNTLIGMMSAILSSFGTAIGQFQTMVGAMEAVNLGFINIQNSITFLMENFNLINASVDTFKTSLLNAQTQMGEFFSSISNSTESFAILTAATETGMQGMVMAVQNGMANVQTTMDSSIGALASAVGAGFGLVSSAVSSSMETVIGAVQTSMTGVVNSISTSMSSVADQAKASFSTISTSISGSISQISRDMSQGMSGVSQTISSRVTEINSQFTKMSSTVSQIISSMMTAMSSSVQNGMGVAANNVYSGMSQIISTVGSYTGSARSSGYNVGYYISAGIASGMYANMWEIESAANRIIYKAREAARAAADIHSPSRLFAKDVGKFIPQGVAMGIANEMPSTIKQMTKTFKSGFSKAADGAVSQGQIFAEAVSSAVNSVGDMLDVAIDDMSYSPKITPIVDTSKLDKFKLKDYDVNIGEMNKSLPKPSYSGVPNGTQQTTINNDNSNKEFNVNVRVDTNGQPVNAKSLAKEIQQHIKDFDDQNRRSKGEEVFW